MYLLAQEAEAELRVALLLVVGVPRRQRVAADAEDAGRQEQEQRRLGGSRGQREAGKWG